MRRPTSVRTYLELLYGRRRSAYRILFTIDGQTVNVLRVRHAAQDRLKPGDV